MQTGQILGVEWHFFMSPVTGKVGGSAPLMDALQQNGIGAVVH